MHGVVYATFFLNIFDKKCLFVILFSCGTKNFMYSSFIFIIIYFNFTSCAYNNTPLLKSIYKFIIFNMYIYNYYAHISINTYIHSIFNEMPVNTK